MKQKSKTIDKGIGNLEAFHNKLNIQRGKDMAFTDLSSYNDSEANGTEENEKWRRRKKEKKQRKKKFKTKNENQIQTLLD